MRDISYYIARCYEEMAEAREYLLEYKKRRIFKQYQCDFEVKDVVFWSVYSDYITAGVTCRCRICVSTKRGYSFYTFLTKFIKTDGFCGPVER